MVAWCFQGIGVLLGAHWAYAVLGWGGYWAWDPVENAALLHGITGTAFLHSVMMQEKRGMMKVWNVWLVFRYVHALHSGDVADADRHRQFGARVCGIFHRRLVFSFSWGSYSSCASRRGTKNRDYCAAITSSTRWSRANQAFCLTI